VQGKPAFGRFLQGLSIRPWAVFLSSGKMRIAAYRPDSRGFHLACAYHDGLPIANALEREDADTFHVRCYTHMNNTPQAR
jgi:hypothetical protein